MAIVGSVALAVLLIVSSIWMGNRAKKDTEDAVRTVSLLYLDELAGRREKVVENHLQEKIKTIYLAIDLMNQADLSDATHLMAYQSRMRRLFSLDKFAFVDREGQIYTSVGIQSNIGEYGFDYQTLTGPEVSVFDSKSGIRQVIIAVPVGIPFQDTSLSVCFMAINMDDMLSGLSLATETGGTTFCNIYTNDGTSLTDAVLGGLAAEDNLIGAMDNAAFEAPYTYEGFVSDMQEGRRGVVSFTYDGIRETLAYIPVAGTDWQLTYLIRESVLSDRIRSITFASIRRSVLQSLLTAAAMAGMFGFLLTQIRRSSQLQLERERSDAENRVKQQGLEQRLALQEKLIAEQQRREQQDKMINALTADYWSVYYVELDKDEGVCYQPHGDLEGKGLQPGERFPYMASVVAYANTYVTEEYREEVLRFVQPDSIRAKLRKNCVISCTYLVRRHGVERYESVHLARVRGSKDLDDSEIQKVSACFVDVDAQTRRDLTQRQVLSDALKAAEEASRAKTAFLAIHRLRHGNRHQSGVPAPHLRRLQSGGVCGVQQVRQLRTGHGHHQEHCGDDERHHRSGEH